MKQIRKPHSEEAKQKMREARLKNPVSFWKGKKFSQQHIENLRKVRRGAIVSPFTLEHINNLRLARLGEKNPAWKGGITPLNKTLRNSREYILWREAVFARDNYTCIWCGARGVYLNADHIKPFAHYPELRFAIDNGRTLCVPCHETTDTYKGRSINYKKS